VEIARVAHFQAAPTTTRKEAAFTLCSVGRKDIIPDGVTEIGYADDSLIVCTVFFHRIPVLQLLNS
jgi:uncharacterized membrane protein YkvA (DUF1232 family)